MLPGHKLQTIKSSLLPCIANFCVRTNACETKNILRWANSTCCALDTAIHTLHKHIFWSRLQVCSKILTFPNYTMSTHTYIQTYGESLRCKLERKHIAIIELYATKSAEQSQDLELWHELHISAACAVLLDTLSVFRSYLVNSNKVDCLNYPQTYLSDPDRAV